ncbi:S46 family peptidase [Gaoshiqia sediminis]|uniref:Dipeptidyl-peptidase n=1 Tax=Gaoshiqia sediminis TaxID=2986998 RepID=A0AA42C7G1_9BACT|nr:S46 family peptidase [Gaoshiqia sediminis]MCW0484953.1 S46 family peptidase [Gaoshiqia sediminis]
MMRKLLFGLFLLFYSCLSFAKEGMWLPMLLEKYNIEEMQQLGFRLTAEDIYSVNQNSMKDAVVLFGKGCTGELVSNEGLLFTNHHCAYPNIQSHSSVEHDYLTAGFWAKSKEEELPNPGLEVRFLERMEEVTDSALAGTEGLAGSDFYRKVAENSKTIETAASDSGKYEAIVKPVFHGNQYFVYVYKVFKDVRLVGAPPSAIGKFGGDTDNWMWPRHTGDFSVFRIYADQNNEPAEYSPDNVPYRPKSFFPVSLKGVQANDFILVFGFPGSTDQYLPSQAVNLIMNQTDPDKVRIRTRKLELLSKHMAADPKVRIQYASKYARTANAWKKWQGEIKGLKSMDALKIKKQFEQEFQEWSAQSDSLTEQYADVLPQFEKLYIDLEAFNRANSYYDEIVFRGTDILALADLFPRTENGWQKASETIRQRYVEELGKKVQEHFKDYDQTTDEDVFVQLLRMLKADLDPSFLPLHFHRLMEVNDDEKLLRKVYRKSVFTDEAKLTGLVKKLDEKHIKKLQKDPLMAFYKELRGHYQRNVEHVYRDILREINQVQRTYMAGIMAMEQNRALYPDANLTLRVAYGNVEGYQPADGVYYKHFTTLKGIMEKDDPGVYDYNVPQRLRDLYAGKDYGTYASDGELPVAFAASVHTTGGNSGSPAINANGELVGINFDRCWEGTMSDILFDPDRCRNIMIDIRYVLFLIDKFAGAGYLLDEMNLVLE